MRWRAVWEATDVTEDGVTASGYGAENASEIRAVRYSLVGGEVIPSNKSTLQLNRRTYSPSDRERQLNTGFFTAYNTRRKSTFRQLYTGYVGCIQLE